jgi:hypothetical protein
LAQQHEIARLRNPFHGHRARVQTSKEVPEKTLKKRRPNSLLLRSLRCLLWGEQKETKETENNGEGFEFAGDGDSLDMLTHLQSIRTRRQPLTQNLDVLERDLPDGVIRIGPTDLDPVGTRFAGQPHVGPLGPDDCLPVTVQVNRE